MIETEETQAAPEAPPEQPKKRRQKKRDMMRIEALEKLMQETGGDVDPDTIVSMYSPTADASSWLPPCCGWTSCGCGFWDLSCW